MLGDFELHWSKPCFQLLHAGLDERLGRRRRLRGGSRMLLSPYLLHKLVAARAEAVVLVA